jgi:hypothetical protein
MEAQTPLPVADVQVVLGVLVRLVAINLVCCGELNESI